MHAYHYIPGNAGMPANTQIKTTYKYTCNITIEFSEKSDCFVGMVLLKGILPTVWNLIGLLFFM